MTTRLGSPSAGFVSKTGVETSWWPETRYCWVVDEVSMALSSGHLGIGVKTGQTGAVPGTD